MKPAAANFIRAMLDGATGAGLLRRLNYPGAPSGLEVYGSVEEAQAARRRDRFAFRFALGGLIFGGLMGLSLIGAFVYLVTNKHEVAAGLVLSGWILAIVAEFLISPPRAGN